VRRYSEINRSVEGGGKRRRRSTRKREREKFRDSREAPVSCSGTATRKRREKKRERERESRENGARNLRFHLVARASARVRRDSHPEPGPSGQGPRETGPTCRPSRGPFALRPPAADAARSSGGVPRRCNRGGNLFPGERAPTAFSRYASRPR